MTVLWLLHKFGGGIQFKPLRIEQSKQQLEQSNQELEKSNHQLKSTCQFLQALTQKKHYQRRTLSHVLVSKYADHLSLYCQHLIYHRIGVDLARSTLADGIGRCGVELDSYAYLSDVLKNYQRRK